MAASMGIEPGMAAMAASLPTEATPENWFCTSRAMESEPPPTFALAALSSGSEDRNSRGDISAWILAKFLERRSFNLQPAEALVHGEHGRIPTLLLLILTIVQKIYLSQPGQVQVQLCEVKRLKFPILRLDFISGHQATLYWQENEKFKNIFVGILSPPGWNFAPASGRARAFRSGQERS